MVVISKSINPSSLFEVAMARIQLALNVPDLAQAVAFSTSLFDAVTDDMPATAEPAGCCTA